MKCLYRKTKGKSFDEKNKNIAHVQSYDSQGRVMDASSKQWVYNFLPCSLWFYAQLARWDRPIGWQLLMWPCFWSTTMAFFLITYITILFYQCFFIGFGIFFFFSGIYCYARGRMYLE